MGKTNNQTIGVSSSNAPSVSVRPNSRVESIDQSNNTTNELDLRLLVIAIIGWLAPSPSEMGRGLMNLFKRRKDNG